MKKFLAIVLSLLCVQLYAQEETLFSDLEVIGAFGGPLIEIGSINGEVGADVGGGGALVLNDFFLGGYGMGTDYPEYSIAEGPDAGDYNIKFKHGGLWFGFTQRQFKLVHFYSSVKLGWGRTQLREDRETRYTDRIFALVPEAGIELNVAPFFKIGFTGGYRWVNGIDKLPGLGNEDFSSPVGIINFRFGGFGNTGDWGDWNWD